LYLLVPGCKAIPLGNSFLVTAQNFTWTDFIIFPKFIFAGSAANN
jgi:hypothetical protein